jgi:hypothetical protein
LVLVEWNQQLSLIVAMNFLVSSNNLKGSRIVPKLFLSPSVIFQKNFVAHAAKTISIKLVAVVVMSALPIVVWGRSRGEGRLSQIEFK